MKAYIILLLLVGLGWQTGSAQVNSVDLEPEVENKDWRVSFTPYAFLAAQATDVGGEKIRQSFNDLSSITNAGFQFIGSVRYKRFSFSVDGTFATLASTVQENRLTIDMGIKQNIIDLKAGYTLFQGQKTENNRVINAWSVEVLAGVKNWVNNVVIDLTIDLGPIGSVEERIREPLGWWDPMIGTRANFAISKNFVLSAAVNVGGFGIGDASDFTHDLTYVNAFKVWKHMTINAGFRSFKYSREDGGVDTTVSVLGPLLGVSFFTN